MTDTVSRPHSYAPAARLPAARLLFTVEFLASIGGNLLQVGIFFYTNRRFGWGLRENFTLAAVQGIVYVVGALMAHHIASRLAPRRALALLYAIVATVVLFTLAFDSPAAVVTTVLVYTGIMAMTWPMLEALVAAGVSPKALGKRMAWYNVIWAGAGALTLAVNGFIIEYWPAGVFVLTSLVHGVSTLALSIAHLRTVATQRNGETIQSPVVEEAPLPAGLPAEHVDPEPELLHVRTLALWLSRISMPASYALIYALSALLPSLPPMQKIPTWAATLVGSVWLASRLGAFLLLGLHDWWHTRPRSLVLAAWLMLVMFAAVAWQPSTFLGHAALGADLAWLIGCQIIIGLVLGLIYSASLYFGMALSEGSTEHGGYHEALIGFGSILGPGAGALAQLMKPGNVTFGVFAVSSVLLVSTLLATGASIKLAHRRE